MTKEYPTKLYLHTNGEPDVGIYGYTYECDIPQGLDDELLKEFINDMKKLYESFSDFELDVMTDLDMKAMCVEKEIDNQLNY